MKIKALGIELVRTTILLAIVAVVAANAQVFRWSQTAGSNATADPSVNWSEGMAPSAVNDSARAMMASVAKWRDDNSGKLTTTGTSTAYAVTTNSGFTSPPTDGQLVVVTMHTTNGVAPTLAADSGTAYAIQTSPGVAVGAATLIQGTPYSMKFSLADSAWILRDVYGSAYNVPLGGIVFTTISTAPNSNFVSANGQCISTTTYATYWVAMGSPASGSCPGGQFAVADMRGRVPVALDTLPGAAAANRLTSGGGCGTAMTTFGASCVNGTQDKTLTVAQIPAHSHGVTDPGHTHTVDNLGGISVGTSAQPGVVTSGTKQSGSSTTGISINNAGGGQSHSTMDPNFGLYPWLRVL